MNKKVIIVVVVAVLVIGGGAFALLKNKDNNSGKTGSASSSGSFAANVKDACDVLTLNDAKKVLGEVAQSGDNSASGAGSETDDIAVSNCVYSNGGTNFQNIVSASLLARSAKTEAGADSNRYQFEGGKPNDAQDVSGYGDAAYWSPEFGQLNILKNNNWYIVSFGTSRPSDHKLEDAKKLADTIKDKL